MQSHVRHLACLVALGCGAVALGGCYATATTPRQAVITGSYYHPDYAYHDPWGYPTTYYGHPPVYGSTVYYGAGGYVYPRYVQPGHAPARTVVVPSHRPSAHAVPSGPAPFARVVPGAPTARPVR